MNQRINLIQNDLFVYYVKCQFSDKENEPHGNYVDEKAINLQLTLYSPLQKCKMPCMNSELSNTISLFHDSLMV